MERLGAFVLVALGMVSKTHVATSPMAGVLDEPREYVVSSNGRVLMNLFSWWRAQPEVSKIVAKPIIPPPKVLVPPDVVPSLPLAPVAPPALTGHKLTPDAQRRLCTLLGQFRYPAEIVATLQKEFGVTIVEDTVGYYKHSGQWKLLVQEARANFISHLNEVPIANKVVRLDRYEQAYQKAIAANDLNQALQSLVAAHREMEKVHGDTTVYVHQQILNMDTHALEVRRREIAERLSQLGVVDAVGKT